MRSARAVGLRQLLAALTKVNVELFGSVHQKHDSRLLSRENLLLCFKDQSSLSLPRTIKFSFLCMIFSFFFFSHKKKRYILITCTLDIRNVMRIFQDKKKGAGVRVLEIKNVFAVSTPTVINLNYSLG